MPATSARQQKFMGAELGRMRAGKKTKTGMGEEDLRDFARKPGRSKRRSGMKGHDAAEALSGYRRG